MFQGLETVGMASLSPVGDWGLWAGSKGLCPGACLAMQES